MATYNYKVYKKQVSYDGGQTWYDVDPLETIKKTTAWDVECSGITYAGKISVQASCDPNDKYVWLLADNKNIIESADVRKLWGGAGPEGTIVGHDSYDVRPAIHDCSMMPQISDYTPRILHIMPNCTEIGIYAFWSNLSGISMLRKIVFEGTPTLRKISENAFSDTGLNEKLVLPNSVEIIKSGAFNNTECLTHVNIGSGITSLSSTAFNLGSYKIPKVITINNPNPPTLVIPSGSNYPAIAMAATVIVPNNSVSSYRTSWGGSANSSFYITSSANTSHSYEYGTELETNYSDNLTAITTSNVQRNTETKWVKFGDSVIEIGNNLFNASDWGAWGDDFHSLNYVKFGNNLKKIGNFAFKNTPTFELDFPDSLEEIGDEAFSKLEVNTIWALQMEKLHFGSGLKKIGVAAFAWNRIARIDLPSGLEEIGEGAFNGCDCNEIIWPTSLKKIGSSAFAGNFHNKYDAVDVIPCEEYDIVIPNSVEEIGEYLFGGGVNDLNDSTIRSITFGTSLTKIGNLRHYSNYFFTQKLIFTSTTPPTVVDQSFDTYTEVYVPCESILLYRNTSPFNLHPEQVHAIEDNCSQKRWVTFGYKDINGQLYPNEIEQESFDSGTTWENTGNERQSSTSVGSSSYSAVTGVIRYNTSSGTTDTIPSLGVIANKNTHVQLKLAFTYLNWRGGTNGYMVGDNEEFNIIPNVSYNNGRYGFIYNIANGTLTSSYNSGVFDFYNYYITCTESESSSPRYVTGTTSASSVTSSSNLGLYNGDVTGGVMLVKIYNGNTLIRDFEPRYLPSLNTATLYDKVSNTYCQVNGTLDYWMNS